MTTVEHEIQRLMLERLDIEWVAGEPFYSLVEAEIVRLRSKHRELLEHHVMVDVTARRLQQEIDRLRDELRTTQETLSACLESG